MTAKDDEIKVLRDEIDGIDESLHDLIMKRVAMTRRIGEIKGAKGNGAVFLRPGREAAVLRRLVARHRGAFPVAALVRVWREIMGATLCLQGPFAVAVFAPKDHRGYWDLARDHFGTEAPMTAYGSTRQVLAALNERPSVVGILPWPHEAHSDPWWRHLVSRNANPLRIIAGLPFVAGLSIIDGGRDRGDAVQALVVGHHPGEATGRDRSFLAVETVARISRPRLREALDGIGPTPNTVAVWRGDGKDGTDLHLVEVDGMLTDEDPGIKALSRKGRKTIRAATVLGGYAEPISAADIGAVENAQ
ncbi:MAG: chorismate mutase [Alphaproteobacteria bacterium]